ncbi:hypothetical protein [Nesterenkonia populi]|uniref:hypothetical protein n=1 Tax=Nesterenkonia populi TaxID=1591087 RepID=UPI0011BECD4E|nr:hypothetical protein [Nesterenkonia populi]
MPDLLHSQTVTARKPHRCSTCQTTAVQPGETYTRDTLIYDGAIYDWVQCQLCAGLFSRVWDAYGSPYRDEGIGPDDYAEWASETVRGNYGADERALAQEWLTQAGLGDHHEGR